MVITIDGPAGSGKSTVAGMVAKTLGISYLKTGAMYRAVALAGMRAGVDWADHAALVRVAEKMKLEFNGPRIFVDGEDVSVEVESLPVTAVTKYSAENPGVRDILSCMQREFGMAQDCVAEGREQGTVVFPDAAFKFFLDASPEERARRRFRQKCAQGEAADYEGILAGIIQRDREDSQRKIAPLKPAPDAALINSDGMTAEEVVAKIVAAVRAKYPEYHKP